MGSCNSMAVTGRKKLSKRSRVGAVVSLVVVLLGASIVVPTGVGAETLEIDSATFEWDINLESNAAAFNGSCHYLSAGESDGSIDTYLAQSGDVSVVKLDQAGEYQPISDYASRCFDKDGIRVSPSNSRLLGQKVLIENGVGTVNPTTGEAEISWTGTFSITYYGSLIPFWIADPSLHIDADGNGTLVANIGGYASSIENPDERESIDLMEDVVVGTFGDVASANEDGVVINFDYLGVEYVPNDGEGAPQVDAFDNWGAWPTEFIEALRVVGLAEFWYSTGGIADNKKAPSPLVVGYGEGTAPTVPSSSTTSTIPATVPSVTFPTTSTTTPPPTTAPPSTTTTLTAPVLTPTAPSSAGLTQERPQRSNQMNRPSQNQGTNGGSRASIQRWNTQRSGSDSRDANRSAANRSTQSSVGHNQGQGSQFSAAAMLSELAPNHLGWSVNIAEASVRLTADSATANKYVGSLPDITIADARGGSPWVVTGQISNDAANLGQYFGWIPQIRSGGPGVIPGEVVNGGSGSRTLTNPSLLATSSGGSTSSVTIGADIELNLPLGTAVGDQPTMLTITALG